MLRSVALVRSDVSEDLSPSFIRVAASVVPSSPILVTPVKEALSFSETSVLTRVTQHNIQEDTVLQQFNYYNFNLLLFIFPVILLASVSLFL
jgi:hypothetical protein